MTCNMQGHCSYVACAITVKPLGRSNRAILCNIIILKEYFINLALHSKLIRQNTHRLYIFRKSSNLTSL